LKKILFIAEAVAWSNVVRLVVLARGLDPNKYQVHFASARFDEHLFQGSNFARWHLTATLSPEKIGALVASGSIRRVYDKQLLEKYVADELHLYEAIQPDLVVADARFWSTPISAPAFGVPCASLIDAHWSRHTTRKQFPVPNHAIVRMLGVRMAQRIFPVAKGVFLRYFAAPTNTLRRKHGLPPLGDLFDLLTWGDRVLYPNDPLLTPLTYQAPHETFLGPILWSPQMPLPAFWDELGCDRPMIYAALGSSGSTNVVPLVLKALGGMDVDVVFSTGARFKLQAPPPNVRVVDMIPGHLAARKAAVVICNGGTGPGYQALAEGTPIVGIPSNIDSLLAAIALRDAGVGEYVRAVMVTAARVRAAVERVMRDESFTQTAQHVAESFARFDPHARFRAVVDEVTAQGGTD
jgi:UDP:flavonoid glycosyltransferase YjiC (YdhE family)